jgi:hypothetical protein
MSHQIHMQTRPAKLMSTEGGSIRPEIGPACILHSIESNIIVADYVTLVHEKNPETIAEYPQGELSPTRQKSVFSHLEHNLSERIAVGNRTQALWKMHFSMQFSELYNFCSQGNL